MLCSPFEVGPKELNTVIKGPSELALRARAVCGDPAVRKLQAPLGHLEAEGREPESAAGHASAWSPEGAETSFPPVSGGSGHCVSFCIFLSLSLPPLPPASLLEVTWGGGETCRP